MLGVTAKLIILNRGAQLFQRPKTIQQALTDALSGQAANSLKCA